MAAFSLKAYGEPGNYPPTRHFPEKVYEDYVLMFLELDVIIDMIQQSTDPSRTIVLKTILLEKIKFQEMNFNRLLLFSQGPDQRRPRREEKRVLRALKSAEVYSQ